MGSTSETQDKKEKFPWFDTSLSNILMFYKNNALSKDYDWEVVAVDGERDKVVLRGSPPIMWGKERVKR